MARAAVSKTPTVVTITTPWQIAFITAVVLSQAVWAFIIAWSYTRRGQYISAGTWAWQVSTWLYPLLFVLAGYVFVRRRVRGCVPQLFWAVFLATIGYGLGIAETALSNWLRHSVLHMPGGTGSSWWAAFGWDWSQMIVIFVLFCGVLAVITKKGKRA